MATEHVELSAYLDGELSERARREVEARLQTDPQYAAELETLERTCTMILTSVDHPGFHRALMQRIAGEEAGHRQTNWLPMGALLAAGIALLLGTLAFLQSDTSPSPPAPRPEGNPVLAVAPQEKTEFTPETPLDPEYRLAQGPESAVETAVSTADATIELPPITVLGTMTGDAPQAILRIGDENASTGTFAVGDEVLPGAVLESIDKGQVTLNVAGVSVPILGKREAPESYADKLNGLWRLHQVQPDGRETFMEDIRLRREGTDLIVEQPTKSESTRLAFRLSGGRLLFTPEAGAAFPPLEGTLSSDGNTLDLLTILSEEELRGGQTPEPFRLKRLSEEAAKDSLARHQALAECEKELNLMYEILKKNAGNSSGVFPSSLKAIFLSEDEKYLFEESPERQITYTSGLEFFPLVDLGPEPSPQPEDTYPDRLMAHEQALLRAGYDKVLWRPVILKLSYPGERIEGQAYVGGGVRVDDLDLVGSLSAADSTQLAALRASDQNNQKQLGLVIKMYENEHRGYSPPGWLSVYPEYLTDTNVLTCPLDPPGTDSYEYLLPATHLDRLAEETIVGDPENPSAMAKAQSEIPVLLNKTDWPDGGRNILFCDGHVEYRRDWQEVLRTAP